MRVGDQEIADVLFAYAQPFRRTGDIKVPAISGLHDDRQWSFNLLTGPVVGASHWQPSPRRSRRLHRKAAGWHVPEWPARSSRWRSAGPEETGGGSASAWPPSDAP